MQKGINKPNFSKLIVVSMVVISIAVLAFAMYEMHRQNDLSSLSVLIGATIAEVMGIGIFYLKKSTVENSKGGITYDTLMKQIDDETKG